MARYKIDCCNNCDTRHAGCHAACEDYKRQRAELDATNAERFRRNKITANLNSSLYDSVERSQRWIHMKGR